MNSEPLLRIYFKGKFSINTPTANNNNVDYILDADNARINSWWASMDDSQLRLAMTTTELQSQNGQTILQMPSYWDYYGDNHLTFDKVAITGADDVCGAYSFDSKDPFINTPVDMTAVLVDLDPTGQVTSQLFIDNFTFGAGDHLCEGSSPTRAHSYWLYIPRNLNAPDGPSSASAVFQSVIDPKNIKITNAGKKQSQILKAISENASKGYSLVVQLCFYFATPPDRDPRALSEQYAKGKTPKNPKRGFVIGTVSLQKLNQYDLTSMPPGRLLLPPRTFNPPNALPLGPTLAQVNEDGSVTLNLINTFPETGPDLEKVNLGDATLQVVDRGGNAHTVGTFSYNDYNKEAYEKTSGLITVKNTGGVKPVYLNAALFQLTLASPGPFGPNPVLKEADYVIATDDRNVYLDFGEVAPIKVHVFRRGKRVPNVRVQTAQFRSVMTDPGARANMYALPNTGLAPNQGYVGSVVKIRQEKVTDRYGIATFIVRPNFPGITCLPFWVAGQPQPPDPDMFSLLNAFFANVRSLPNDNGLDAQFPAPTWNDVYQQVLRYYYILYPVMDEFLPLNNQQAVQAAAANGSLGNRISKQIWNTTHFMPVTREMSAGKRRLLERWISIVQKASQTKQEKPQPEPKKVAYEKVKRAR